MLSKTRIENATATVAQDKDNILTLVSKHIGCRELNGRVNVVLREWISKVLKSEGNEDRNQDMVSNDGVLAYAAKLGHIAIALRKLDKKHEALSMLKKALAIQEEALGKDHPSTATTYNRMGLTLKKMGDTEGALSFFQQLLSVRLKTLGEHDPKTVRVRKIIEEWTL